MMTHDTLIPKTTYTGHFKNGVVVLDSLTSMNDGQEVRIEPIAPNDALQDRLERMKQLFDTWTDEDRELSEEDAGLLRTAIQQNDGVTFRSVTIVD